MSPSGILLVDKPGGMTSHDVVVARPQGTRNPQGRPRRHARPDGDRPAAARRRQRDAPADLPRRARQGVHRDDPARRRDRHRRRRGRGHRDRRRERRSTRAGDRRAIGALTGELVAGAVELQRGQGRRAPLLRPRASGRGGRARAAHRDRSPASTCSTSAARQRRSTWMSSSHARRAPTSGPSRAIWAPPSASAGTSRRCAARSIGDVRGPGCRAASTRSTSPPCVRRPRSRRSCSRRRPSTPRRPPTSTHGKRVALAVADAPVVAAVTADGRLAGLVSVTDGVARRCS